jgi:hypothetical protein
MREDALERSEVLTTGAYAPSLVSITHLEAPPPTFPCPNCELVYSDRARLSDHLFHRHGTHGFYLRVNDTVPADVVVVPDRPWQLDAVATGADPIRLVVTMPGGHSSEVVVAPGSAVSLLRFTDGWTVGTPILIRSSDRFDRTYTIYRDLVPDLNLDMLDELVLRAQERLYAGGSARWELLLGARRPGEALRTRYLEGFAELLLGVNMEIHSRDFATATRSYTRAFGQLRVFGTPLARAAASVLAWRMDAYALVLRQGPNSTLWASAHWYSSPPRVPDVITTLDVAERGIWIDDYMEGLIDVAHQAIVGNPDEALSRWRTLPATLADGPGYPSKHDIAGARLARAAGDTTLSRRLFTQLANHPVYESEARQALS